MKNRIVTLLFVALFALPALAQTTTPAAAAPAASSTNATGKTP